MERLPLALSRYLKSHDFRTGLLMTLTIFGASMLLYLSGHTSWIIGVALGILLTAFCDIQGSYRYRTLAMLLAIAGNMFTILVINLLYPAVIPMTIYLVVGTFAAALLVAYGQRGGLLSASLLLGLVLSLVRHFSGVDILYHALRFGAGGLLYVLVSNLHHYLTGRRQVYEQLGQLARLTGNYLGLQTRLLEADRTEHPAADTLHELQTRIAQQQEELRELLLTSANGPGQSRSKQRQMRLLVALVDTMELALAHPVDIDQLRRDLGPENEEILAPFLATLRSLRQRLHQVSRALLDRKERLPDDTTRHTITAAQVAIRDYTQRTGIPAARPVALRLLNYCDYLQQQDYNLSSCERLLNRRRVEQNSISQPDVLRQFVSLPSFNPDILRQHLSFDSPVFRHALRLAIAVLAGYTIGRALGVQNAYWILLTLAVIMRPSYGLTWQRSRQRIAGTIIGVLVSAAIVYLTEGAFWVNVTVALISSVLAFSLLSRNYLWAAAAVTVNVIFVFALLQPDLWGLIQYRLIDTLIGGALAVVTSYLLFPHWEREGVRLSLARAVQAAQQYLSTIKLLYAGKDSEVEYRISRQQAVLAASNVTEALRRYEQEPPSKRQQLPVFRRLQALNQSLLTNLAALGSYVQRHQQAGVAEELRGIGEKLQQDLEWLHRFLTAPGTPPDEQPPRRYHYARQQLDEHLAELEYERDLEIEQGKLDIDPDMRLRLQEVHFIQDELALLDDIVVRMKITARELSAVG